MAWGCFRFALALAVALACLAVRPALAQGDGRRIALVVGNSAYTHAPPLPNPRLDAERIGNALEAAGFQVILGLDLDKGAFDLKLREFAAALANAEDALFFYAGHGLQIANANYIVPVDAKLGSERDVPLETTRMDVVQEQMEFERPGRTSIIILDACRDNPLATKLARSLGTRSASVGRGLAQMQAAIDTFIVFSTHPGSVALDGKKGENSPFTSALLHHILTPGKPLTSITMDVRREVIAATSQKQVPWDHSALTREFFFVPSAGASTQPAAPPPPRDMVPKSEFEALKARLEHLEQGLAAGPEQKTAALPPAKSPTTARDAKTQPKTLAQAVGPGGCVALTGSLSGAIPLTAGLKLCRSDGNGRAIIKRIVREAVIFVTEGARYETTCRPRDVCQFDWDGAPLFGVRIDVDTGTGDVRAEMVPKG